MKPIKYEETKDTSDDKSPKVVRNNIFNKNKELNAIIEATTGSNRDRKGMRIRRDNSRANMNEMIKIYGDKVPANRCDPAYPKGCSDKEKK